MCRLSSTLRHPGAEANSAPAGLTRLSVGLRAFGHFLTTGDPAQDNARLGLERCTRRRRARWRAPGSGQDGLPRPGPHAPHQNRCV